MRQTLYPKRIVDCAGAVCPGSLLLRQTVQLDYLEGLTALMAAHVDESGRPFATQKPQTKM